MPVRYSPPRRAYPLGDIVTAATDQVAAVGPVNAAGITALSCAYNQVLYGGLAAARIQVIPLGTFSLLRDVGADPARFGFANVTAPACGLTPPLVCTSGDFVAPGADQSFLFADSVHPTTAPAIA